MKIKENVAEPKQSTAATVVPERRRLVVLLVDGPLPPSFPTDRWKATWQSISSKGGALCFGVKKRSEDDVERALDLATNLLDLDLRGYVTELLATIDGNNVELAIAEEHSILQGKAQSGEVLVSADISRIYERLFLFEELEPGPKGVSLLRGRRLRPARLRGLTPAGVPLVGREKEHQRLEELLEQIENDQGQGVSLIGPAGIGKSRLLGRISQYASPKISSVCRRPISNTTEPLNPTQEFEKLFKPFDHKTKMTLHFGS